MHVLYAGMIKISIPGSKRIIHVIHPKIKKALLARTFANRYLMIISRANTIYVANPFAIDYTKKVALRQP
jgi:hypothetical protein